VFFLSCGGQLKPHNLLKFYIGVTGTRVYTGDANCEMRKFSLKFFWFAPIEEQYMNFIWLKSGSGDAPDLPADGKDIVVVDPGEDPMGAAVQHHCAAIIAEVTEGDDCERVVQLLKDLQGACPVLIYQPEATVSSAVSFIKTGASSVSTSLKEIERAMQSLRDSSATVFTAGRALIGDSRAMRDVSSSIGLVANRRCNVLIEGETGTGKEVVAQEIHRSGNRSRGPWVAVNCGAIPDTLLEAELFGHVKGAFTGAIHSRAGKFEAANHGTIFLDEIGDMPFAVQAKLLRVLQEHEIERLGGNERIRLDVRVIAATNVNLMERVKQGLFRQDLYYRLNVFQIMLPPLRERTGDIPALARHFVARICAGENLRPKTLDTSALDQLSGNSWPGNARELENVMETAVVLSGTRSTIFASDIRLVSALSRMTCIDQVSRVSLPSGGLDYQQALETFEHDLLTQALTRTRGNKTAAADLLHLKRTTLSARMRVLESRMPRLVA
jgi:DNA-binding NtrC family response regulator